MNLLHAESPRGLGLSIALSVASVATSFAGEWETGEIIVWLNPGYTIDEVNTRWGTTTIDTFPDGGLYLVYTAGVDDGLSDLAEAMADTDPAVFAAEPNYLEDTPEGIRAMVIAAVGGTYVDFEDQTMTSRIDLDAAHSITRGGGVTVAVLDTGVDPLHEALRDRLTYGYDFVEDDSAPWEETDGIDGDGDGTVDEGYGHGTMVAGLVALVAPNATILPVRILDDDGRADAFRIVEGIRYATIHGADVINMSFGVPQLIKAIDEELDHADGMGVVCIAGAGNAGREEPAYFPAIDTDALMITALDSVDVKADFADWNSRVLVSAPGTGVRSALPGGGWGLGAGCSFATPIVTGCAALIISASPGITGEAVEERLKEGIDPIYHLAGNDAYIDKLGTGRINALSCLMGLVAVPGAANAFAAGELVAFPNPSRGAVRFTLSGGASVTGIQSIDVFDAGGRVVSSIRSAGTVLAWDGSMPSGTKAPAGVYYAVIRTSGGVLRSSVRIIQ